MNTLLCGDALTLLRTLPECSVQMCVTSPPYYGLRDYGVSGQIGLEETPQQYIATMVQVFREVRRVLREDGTLWLNIGDSYAHDTKWGGTTGGKHVQALHGDNPTRARRHTGFAPKNLMMMPARVAIALQDDGWILRSDIIWHKPNCMPESVTDRPTSAHEHIFLLAKSERYYYDADAIREPHETALTDKRRRVSLEDYETAKVGRYVKKGEPELHKGRMVDKKEGWQYLGNPAGRNRRDVWTIPSQSYSGAHYATFPPKLIEPMIVAGSRAGDTVLDPFLGAGTTALMAIQHHRHCIGIELNPAYVALIERRISGVQQTLWESEVSA